VRYKSLVLLAIVLFVLSSYTGRLPHPSQSASPQQENIRVFDQPVYCPTQNEEARLLYNRGLELTSQGNLEAAIQAYRKATELDPIYCDAMDNLGQLFRRLGKLDEAISWYKRSVEVLPNNAVAHQNLAIVYRLQGKLDEAISEHQWLTRIDADDPEGYYGLGTDYLEMNELQLALEHLKRAEQLYAKRSSPLIVDTRHALGVTYYKLKDLGKTRYYFEQIYDQERNDPGVNYTLGLCYFFEAKDLNEARKYLKRAQELGVKIPAELVQKLNL
jgi:tetratricopeptide (TPR) repeat protein